MLTNIKKAYNQIISILRNKPDVHLGRWTVEKCNKRTNKKIDFANEDHCGPCGTNLLVKK